MFWWIKGCELSNRNLVYIFLIVGYKFIYNQFFSIKHLSQLMTKHIEIVKEKEN